MSFRFIIAFLFFIFANTNISTALTKIDITRSNVAAVPVAIQTFSSNNIGGANYYEEKIGSLVSADLESCGLFKIIDPESYIEKSNSLENTPNFISWRQINANILVLIDISSSSGSITATLKVWDIFSQQSLLFKKLEVQSKLWRRIAHKISDEIYKRMTGENGYFDTKIAYVSIHGKGDNKIRKLALMDYDGANHTYLTNGDSIVLTPRFSNDASRIIYFSYEDPLRPSIKVFDLNTNKSHLLREIYGMSYAPRYTPDGKSILFAIEKKGVSNVYLYNLDKMDITQLTFCKSICTSPSSSPDQKKIVFNSDMSGGRNIYVMNMHGNNPQRISFNKGNYTNPVWSPKGDLIAFTKTIGLDDFYIGVMRPDGSNERILAYGRLVEGPAWAPNGKALIFERELEDGYGNYYTKLYKIDIISRKEQEIDTPSDATDAYWSNLLE